MERTTEPLGPARAERPSGTGSGFLGLAIGLLLIAGAVSRSPMQSRREESARV
jgi:hypothetical protein